MTHPRFATLTLAVLALAACQDAAGPVPSGSRLAPARETETGSYIVVFRESVQDVPALARSLVATTGGTLRYTYTAALRGFAATLPDAAARALARHPAVAYVERDQVMRTSDVQQMDGNGEPWGLDRIDQAGLPLSRTYTYTATGQSVHAYIIDTGIWTLHADFGGRADNVFDAMLLNGQDCNGHGTHVAGTVGGVTWGVAKAVRLHGVRVLNCAGAGLTSDVIAGVDWVRQHHVKPAVANMSLGGGFSQALNTAVTNLWDAGVFVAVAAGNDDEDACDASPASASGAFTLAATTRADAKASFSNWGTCVEAYAPGAAIRSTWLAGTTMSLSGTSMASPHAAGVGVLYKATFGDAPSATVANWIVSSAATNVVTGNPGGTPNRLLQKSDL